MTFFPHPFDFNCRCEICILKDKQIRENIKKEKRLSVHMDVINFLTTCKRVGES